MTTSCDLMGGRYRFLVLIILAVLVGRAIGGAADAPKTEADRLVAEAAQAELNGNATRSFALLHEAVRVDPDNRLARWQLGELQVDNKWVAAEEAQRRAAVDPKQVEYRERRTAAGQSLQGQLALARWCRKNNLNDEAQFSWASVLALEPKNEEALKALNVRWEKGRLVSATQSAQTKDQLRDAKRAAERWASKIVKWRRAVSGHDVTTREAALAEIRAITEKDAIPSLEDVTLGRDAGDPRHADECLQIGLEFLDALQKMPGQPATESLARHAVFAAGDKARASAIAKLKLRDQHDYVPMLLSGLGMPFESSFSLTTGPDGSVHYFHSLYREGPESDWSMESQRAAIQHEYGSQDWKLDIHTGKAYPGPRTESSIVTGAKKANLASANQRRYGTVAAATESKVARANEAVETLNSRIVPVLEGTTGKDFGDNPKAWWKWWQDENEYYAKPDHPVDRYYFSDTSHYYYRTPQARLVNSGPPQPRVYKKPPPRYNPFPWYGWSCFVKGTLVWTKTGMRPIETIENGDLVLAQDVNTGELQYRPVIGRTVRPPSPIVKISFAKEDVLATKGHPFWLIGSGWRMAKEVADGDVLRAVSGSSVVRKVDAAGEAEAYNLIVADFSSYFVGETGILVHDNTPRTPTQAILPGVVAKK